LRPIALGQASLMSQILGIKRAVVWCPLVALTLSSCIVTYRDFPSATPESTPQVKTMVPIYYRVAPPPEEPFFRYGGPERVGRRGLYSTLARGFAEIRIFSSTAVAEAPPATGIFTSIGVERKPESQAAVIWRLNPLALIINGLLIFIIPSYSGEGGWIVHFDLYLDAEYKKTYKYLITQKSLYWLGLAPFLWINLITYDINAATIATIHQFSIDAEQDGFIHVER
jgi:hypothetical protein